MVVTISSKNHGAVRCEIFQLRAGRLHGFHILRVHQFEAGAPEQIFRIMPLMIPSMIEKFGYVTILAVLYAQGRISATDAQAAVPDLLLGILFIAAFAKSRRAEQRDHDRRG